MADLLDVITLAEAKTAVGIPAASTAYDTPLAAYITAVSRRLDALCGPIVRRTLTGELHDGGTSLVFLRQPPVYSVTTVVEYSGTTGTTLAAESNVTKTSDDFQQNGSYGALYRRASGSDGVFAAGRGNIVITYVAGRYADTATVDQRFKVAAGIMLTNLWRNQKGGGTQTAGPVEDLGLVPTFSIPNAVLELLAEDRRAPAVA